MKRKLVLILVTAILFLAFSVAAFSNNSENASNPLSLPRGVFYSDKVIHIFLRWIDYGEFCDVFNRLEMFSYDKIIIDLFSFGGSVFDALAMVETLEDQQRRGRIVEIRARGIVASAGLIIMMSGTPGYRYLDKNAFIMFHEMQSFKFFAIESVSDQEEQAKISRKIQDSVNKFIALKTKITSEQLSDRIKRKELWCDAEEAVKMGFADNIIGQ